MSASDRPSNLVFVTADHFRFDTLGAVQAGREVTPHLNALVRQSLDFQRAYSACPLCVPARTAMATGRYPHRNGVLWNDWSGEHATPDKTFHEVLQESGYRLGVFGRQHIITDPPLPERLREATWFDEQDHLAARRSGSTRPEPRPEAHITSVVERVDGEYRNFNYSNAHVQPEASPISEREDYSYASQAIRFLGDYCRNSDQQPFALFLNLWAPHPPLKPPAQYLERFPPDQLTLPENVLRVPLREPASRRRGVAAQLAESLDESAVRESWSAHLALSQMVDDLVARVLAELDRHGITDETIVCFTSDHGDHLGQRRMYQKMELYEPAIHVPLFIRIPGQAPAARSQPVSHVDLLPTLVEALDLSATLETDGCSVLSDSGEAAGRDRDVFLQYRGNPGLGDTRLAVVSGDLKCVIDDEGEVELFDLKNDPLEMNNLAGQESFSYLESKMVNRMVEEWGEALVKGGSPAIPPPS